MVDKELLEILACPECKGNVDEKNGKIVCSVCGREYSVTDGIPIMLAGGA